MKKNITIDFLSTDDNNIKQIEAWLIEEDQLSNDGFYCNWDIIFDSHIKNKIIYLKYANKCIGFLAWHGITPILDIDIFEVQPQYRLKGLGKIFIEQCLMYFNKIGYEAVKLKCTPEESHFFWEKVGFAPFPDPYNEYAQSMYYQILSSRQEASNTGNGEIIELWDCQPHINKEPAWVWQILYQDNSKKLLSPIIAPCYYDWRIRWRKNNLIYKDTVVKRFNDICYDMFLIIKDL